MEEIFELNGYLQLLRRLSTSSCDFGAVVVDWKSDKLEAVSDYLKRMPYCAQILSSESSEYESVINILDDYIFSNLLIEDSAKLDLLKWDIVEYFGLASDLYLSNKTFNPLVENGAEIIEIETDYYLRCCLLLTQISKKSGAVIFLGQRSE